MGLFCNVLPQGSLSLHCNYQGWNRSLQGWNSSFQRLGETTKVENPVKFNRILLPPSNSSGRVNVTCSQNFPSSTSSDSEKNLAIVADGKGAKSFKSILNAGLKAGTVGLGGLLAGLNLEGPGSTIQAIGVLALIVAAHECGHFLAARLQNIHVTKFSVGFGPTLLRFKGEKVEYSLRAIPLGGFVAFPDDDPKSEYPPDDPDLLKNRPIYQRALVISAGVLANLALAYGILFTQVSTVGLVQQKYLPGVEVPDVVFDSAAQRGGLKAGDIILSVDSLPLPAEEGSVSFLVDAIKSRVNEPMVFDVLRGPETLSLSVVPDRSFDGSGRIGVQLTHHAEVDRIISDNFFDSLNLAAKEYERLMTTVLDGLNQIFFNFKDTANRVSGPVAIVAVGAEVARADASGLFQFAAIVNLNLAVVNSLPLPALDGGYLVFLIMEALRGGRKLPNGVEQGIMSSGILVMLAVGIVLMIKDTLSLGLLQQL